MPFCKNCGSAVEGQFCARCGTPIAAQAGAAPPPPAAPAYTPQTPPPPAQPYAQPSYGAAPQAAPAAGGMTDNVAGLLCYVLGFITGILFLVIEPYNKNRFVRFHAFQSIFLSVAWFAVMIALAIVGAILGVVLGGFTMLGLMSLLHTVAWLAFMVIWILCLVKAYQGQKFMLPIIGPIAEKQAQSV